MRFRRRTSNLRSFVVAREQTIRAGTDSELLANILFRKTAEPRVKAIDLPSKDFVTDDLPARIESAFPADGLGNRRKKFVLF